MSKKAAHSKKRATSVKKSTNHNKEFLKVYWPYLPLFVLVFFGMTFGYNWQTGATTNVQIGSRGVLAYATDMTVGGLLNATNSQRASNGGLPALTLNSKLNSAAQAKANDMVARNYWSHTTPDGKDPWVFIDATGYSYQKAGENLAYGFGTSSEAVTGWMNSPSHKANVLDTTYKEVGFGIANSSSFVNSGEETVVVAMYANPTAAASSPSSPAAQPSTSTAQSNANKQVTSTPASGSGTQQEAPTTQPTKDDTVLPSQQTSEKKVPDDRYNQAITSDMEIPSSQPTTRITKIQSITSGYAPWSAAALSGILVLVVGMWVIKHAIIVKRVLKDGEKFVMHHPIVDIGVMLVVAVAILLSQSSGVIK